MLASITPLGERGRNSRWGLTVTAFILGSTLAGAGLGAGLGAAGSLVGASVNWRLAVLAGAAVAALALDLGPARVPGPMRQVNERWLDEFRGWVYGLGFGLQLGLGVTTIVTSAATYVALVAACLAGDPWRGAIIAGVFGLARGVTLLGGARVREPDQLLALHRRLARLRRPAWIVGRAAIGLVSVAAAASVL
jgi:cytochrome c biogenesis protein CcdA